MNEPRGGDRRAPEATPGAGRGISQSIPPLAPRREFAWECTPRLSRAGRTHSQSVSHRTCPSTTPLFSPPPRKHHSQSGIKYVRRRGRCRAQRGVSNASQICRRGRGGGGLACFKVGGGRSREVGKLRKEGERRRRPSGGSSTDPTGTGGVSEVRSRTSAAEGVPLRGGVVWELCLGEGFRSGGSTFGVSGDQLWGIVLELWGVFGPELLGQSPRWTGRGVRRASKGFSSQRPPPEASTPGESGTTVC